MLFLLIINIVSYRILRTTVSKANYDNNYISEKMKKKIRCCSMSRKSNKSNNRLYNVLTIVTQKLSKSLTLTLGHVTG